MSSHSNHRPGAQSTGGGQHQPQPPTLRPSQQIPVLTNVAPSMFVPLRKDDVEPPSEDDEPSQRIARLKRIIETIDYHTAAVKENYIWMFEREMRRFSLDAAEREEEFKLRDLHPPGPAETEIDAVFASMERPAPEGIDYNDPNNPFNVKHLPELNPQEFMPRDVSLREKAMMDILTVVEAGKNEIEAYQNHMKGLRSTYVELLGKEQEMLRQAALRPEERTRVQDAPMS
ncbi:hypothetical protein GE21DRAFT_3258 [Neurospora crassa]|uniref:Uncharacterized protein n=2 Tax=Neurospora crassa TaxID=5141 RepID=Q1K5Q8_NEUCR|nr:hypothetical protein NCU01764 [Neurospora crassa OR74A]EAA27951.1 hypothetical protein NCU01764 [Neurospora crassa OR74A]KHE83583.1 hypothetical protein GE21DRAFT_3258 [Neurospora crassa]CAB91231.1 hypothetical protein [Neurospora crassa]|eukprot:XP_957187.1 hypothetical protein NCU01764 [Neurospora crassa OR74A]